MLVDTPEMVEGSGIGRQVSCSPVQFITGIGQKRISIHLMMISIVLEIRNTGWVRRKRHRMDDNNKVTECSLSIWEL